ncbi:MAG TPA: NAD(P)-binding protein [Verrucomicrobiae bacterium]|nr:NAD(P)-binding protein [Verrucomicrobiae bacterium]
MRKSALVVGAGIAGLTAAYTLAKRGAPDVPIGDAPVQTTLGL